MKGQPIQLAAGQFSQMADNTPESLNGVSCPSGGTSWWRVSTSASMQAWVPARA
jgi:hypothetical protein